MMRRERGATDRRLVLLLFAIALATSAVMAKTALWLLGRRRHGPPPEFGECVGFCENGRALEERRQMTDVPPSPHPKPTTQRSGR